MGRLSTTECTYLPTWGVRRGCVCLGSGFGCAPPLLAGVLGCLCACVPVPLVPRHSWLGCVAGVCFLGLRFRLRPATPGWGVGLCVSWCSRSACTPPLLPWVCGVGVCVRARASAAPRHSWGFGVCVCWCVCSLSTPPLLAGVCVVGVCARAPVLAPPRHSWQGCVVCGLAVAWHLFLSLGLLCVVRAARVCGSRWLFWLGTCPRAVVVAGGVPLWRALWPRVGAPRLVQSERSRCSGWLSRRRGAFPHPGGLRPRLYWVAARGTRRPAENRAHCACRWPPAEAGALGSLRVVPVRGPAMGLSLAGPSGVGLGLRALRWLACVDPVSDASGFPYRPSFDGGLGRCTRAVSCGRRQGPFRVGGRHPRVPFMCACACFPGRVWRAGLPGACWWTSPFLVAVPAALLVCWAPSGLRLPRLPCLLVFLPLMCAPLVSSIPCFPARGALGLGVLLSSPPLSFAPPPPRVRLSVLFSFSGFFFSPFFFSCCAGCAVPSWCVVVCRARCCVLLRALSFGGGRCALALPCLVPLACAPLCVLFPGVLCVPVGAVLAALLFRLPPCGVARPFPQALGTEGFFFRVGFLLVVPPPFPWLAALFALWFVVWCGAAVCGVSCVVSVVVWRACVLAPCWAWSCCAVVVVLCFRALLRSLLVFFSALFLAFPWWSGLFLFLYSACAVRCWCACVVALCALLCGLVFCVVVCCVCVLAFSPGCPLLSPGGSWWLLVWCFGGVLWCVPGCRAAPCCCALCRPALCGFVLRCLCKCG